jgi:hypothetical protein
MLKLLMDTSWADGDSYTVLFQLDLVTAHPYSTWALLIVWNLTWDVFEQKYAGRFLFWAWLSLFKAA